MLVQRENRNKKNKWSSLPPLLTPVVINHSFQINDKNPSSIMKVTTIDESLHSSSLSRFSSVSIDRSVRFDHIEIREYDVIIGDHPSVHFGPPISIGWNYDKESMVRIPVEDYETARGPRRLPNQLVIPGIVRYDILHENGVSKRVIAKAVREVNRMKDKRNQTANNLKVSKLEEVTESAFLKLKRFVYRRLRESKEWALWKDEFEKTNHKLAVNFSASTNYEICSSIYSKMSKETISTDEEYCAKENSLSHMHRIVIHENKDPIALEINDEALNTVTLDHCGPDSAAGLLLHDKSDRKGAKDSNTCLTENISWRKEVDESAEKLSTKNTTINATLLHHLRTQTSSSKMFATRAA